MERILVTGATGFIGSHLVRRLLTDGCEIHVLCRPSSSLQRLADGKAALHLHAAPLASRSAVRRTVQTIAPDAIVHLAAATMHGGAPATPADIVHTTLLGTVNLIDACANLDYTCFIHTGDAFEYGPSRRPLRESRHCAPTALDGIAKLAATLYARQAARTGAKPIVTLRLFSVFGPADAPQRLVPRVIEGALTGTPLRLSGPRVTRDFLYVDDLVELYVAVLRAAAPPRGRVYNAGTGRPVTVADIVDTVLALTGSRSEPRWGTFPTAQHDRTPWVADMERTFERFAWRPRTSLRDGLAATIRWARAQPR